MMTRKKFEKVILSGLSGMKRLVFTAHARCVKHLAWSFARQNRLHSPQRNFFYPSCHMPDMPDVFKLFCVKSTVGGIYNPLYKPSGMLYTPPQKGAK